MKTFRLHLPVVDAADTDDLLDLVTDVDGVVAALIEPATATLHIVVATEASALLVRQELLSVTALAASA